MNWHTKSVDETIKFFNVNPNTGLSTTQVKQHRKEYGENILPLKKAKPGWLIFLEQFNDPIIYILIVAAILNALFSDLKDTIVIAVVITLNAFLGYFQERKASDALKALRQMAAPTAKVIRIGDQHPSIREGTQQIIHTTEIVCGDIIVLESGMRVPADARLIDTHNLLVDESMLTGESFHINKRADAIVDENAPLGDRINMLYSGTIIVKGRGTAIVTAVGNNTEFGKISQNVAEADETISPLQIQIEKFGRGLSLAILIAVILIFILGFLRGNELIAMFMTSVALAVSAIPEGLPIAVTVTLSIGVYQMAKHKAIVKKLAAVETLGSTNVICSDKTGTLTKNQMRVSYFFTGFEKFEATGSGYEKEGQIFILPEKKPVQYNHSPALEITTLISALCTETTISDNGKEWNIAGDPTEAALIIATHKMGFQANNWKVYVDIPFESEIQFMAVRAINNNKHYILVKGAPEKILARCKTMIDKNGNILPLEREKLDQQIKEFSDKGLRVLALAFCEKECPNPITVENLENLTFSAFAAIEDSVRPEAIQAVNECYKAGIRVAMITGDHPKTAQAVAKQVGIAKHKPLPEAITGSEIDQISDDELFEKVKTIDVYARVAPNHKYRIVKQLQRHNHIVAMTGDGVNDAPALKQADIGVAMGSGTDVAKESAQIVLMDDNFATIVQAVRRGRVILHNLQHILLYILATSFGGLLTIATSVILGFPIPLLPAQLLWVNLVTDGTSTIPFAFEKEHGNVMIFPPRKKHAPLITKAIIYRIIFVGIVMMLGTLGVYYFYAQEILHLTVSEIRANADLNSIYIKAQTMAFCILSFFQIWNVQNSRSIDRSLFFNLPYPNPVDPTSKEKLDRIRFSQNPILLGVMLLAMLLQVLAVTLPFMNTVFNTTPLNFNEWAIVFVTTFSVIIFIEIFKYISSIMAKIRGKAIER